MPTITQELQAGISHKMPCNGYFFQLLASSSAIDIAFVTSGRTPQTEKNHNIEAGFWFKSPELLTFVELTSDVDQVVSYVYSLGQTGYDRTSLLLKPYQSTGINDKEPTTVTDEALAVVSASAGRTRVVFLADNNNTDVIYLGGEDVTVDNGAIVLDAGDSWIEESASAGNIYAVSSTGGQILRISEA